jgi:hypothetical protein
MAAKLTRPAHKIAIQLHLVAVPFAVLVPGGLSGNFWINPRQTRTYLREAGWEDVDWMHLAQDRDQWRAVVNTVMNLWVP